MIDEWRKKLITIALEDIVPPTFIEGVLSTVERHLEVDRIMEIHRAHRARMVAEGKCTHPSSRWANGEWACNDCGKTGFVYTDL